MTAVTAQTPPGDLPAAHRTGTRRVMRRLLPLVFGIHFLSFVDRTDVALEQIAIRWNHLIA